MYYMSFTSEELQLIYSMIIAPLKMPLAKKKIGKECYHSLCELRDRLRSELELSEVL